MASQAIDWVKLICTGDHSLSYNVSCIEVWLEGIAFDYTCALPCGRSADYEGRLQALRLLNYEGSGMVASLSIYTMDCFDQGTELPFVGVGD